MKTKTPGHQKIVAISVERIQLSNTVTTKSAILDYGCFSVRSNLIMRVAETEPATSNTEVHYGIIP